MLASQTCIYVGSKVVTYLVAIDTWYCKIHTYEVLLSYVCKCVCVYMDRSIVYACMCLYIQDVLCVYIYQQGGTDDECEVETSKRTGYLIRVCMETETEIKARRSIS